MLKKYIGSGVISNVCKKSVNLISDTENQDFYKAIGLNVILDLKCKKGREDICISHGVSLNVVQNNHFFTSLAEYYLKEYNIPFILLDTEFMGIKDLENNLKKVASFFNLDVNNTIDTIVINEFNTLVPKLLKFKEILTGKVVTVLGVEEKNHNYIKDIFKKVGVQVEFKGMSGDVIIADDEFEMTCTKLGKPYMENSALLQILGQGYQGLINMYETVINVLQNSLFLIQISRWDAIQHTKMSLFA